MGAVQTGIVNPWAVSPADIRIMERERKRDVNRSESPEHIARTEAIKEYNARGEYHMANQLYAVAVINEQEGTGAEYEPVSLSNAVPDAEWDAAFADLKPSPELALVDVDVKKHVAIAKTGMPKERPAYRMLKDRPSYKQFNLTHSWPSLPGDDVVNPATGEVTTVSDYVEGEDTDGGAVNVAGLGQHFAMRPQQTRATLASIGILQQEISNKEITMVCDPEETKPYYDRCLRLSEWAVKMRYGRRVLSPLGYEFDLITPAGITYVKEMLELEKALAEPKPVKLSAMDQIKALLNVDPTLRQVDLITRTGLTKMTVHRALVSLKR
jgi:hypothetical protein